MSLTFPFEAYHSQSEVSHSWYTLLEARFFLLEIIKYIACVLTMSFHTAVILFVML